MMMTCWICSGTLPSVSISLSCGAWRREEKEERTRTKLAAKQERNLLVGNHDDMI